MSNNKQIMKLYTEKQLKQIFVTHYFITDKELEDLTPIELPSDEEIKKEMEFDWLDPDDVAYLELVQNGCVIKYKEV